MRVAFYMIGKLQNELELLQKSCSEIQTFMVFPDWKLNFVPNLGDWLQFDLFFDELTLPTEIRERLNWLSENTKVVHRNWVLGAKGVCEFSISLNLEQDYL